MRPRSVWNERVDRFSKLDGVDERFRVMTAGHAALVTGLIAVRADRFRVSFLEDGLLISRDGPVFGRCRGTEEERDKQSFHVKTSGQFYTAEAKLALALLTHCSIEHPFSGDQKLYFSEVRDPWRSQQMFRSEGCAYRQNGHARTASRKNTCRCVLNHDAIADGHPKTLGSL